MTGLPFAMHPPDIYPVWGLSIVVAVLFAMRLVSRPKVRRGQWWQLFLFSLCVGPLMGFLLASIGCKVGGTHPDDVGWTIQAFTGLGLIAGIIGGTAFAVSFVVRKS